MPAAAHPTPASKHAHRRRTPSAAGRTTSPASGARSKPSDLPQPYATKSASNAPGLVARPADAEPKVPDGFKVELVKTGMAGPRDMALAPNGDIFVVDSAANEIDVLRMKDGQAKPAEDAVFASDGLDRPYGIAFYPHDNPQVGLRRQRRQHRALSLQGGRPEGVRPGRDGGRQHPVEPSLDARHRLLAGRRDALRRRRLRLERRRGGQGPARRRHRAVGAEPRRSARCGEPRKAAPR